MRLRSLTLVSFFVLSMAMALRAEIVVLDDGRVLHVKILSSDEKGLRVEMLDSGGKIFIRWDLLRDEDRKRLRVQFGLDEDESGADLVIPGKRVHVKLGNYFDGLIEKEDQEYLHLRSDGRVIPIKMDAIRRIEDREISRFDVYTAQELYDQEKTALGNPADDDIEGQFELARWATKIGLFAEATGHYIHVKEADPTYKAEYIANQLTRLEILDKNKEIQNAIRSAETAGYRHKYAECLAFFDEILAVSSLDKGLRADVQKKKERFEKRRIEYYTELVAHEYNHQFNLKLTSIARDKNIGSTDKDKAMTIDKAMSYVRSQLHKDLIETIGKKLGLDPKNEVEKMWAEHKKGARKTASYGSGSFIILGVQKANGQGGDAQQKQLQDLVDRLRRSNPRAQNQPQQQQQAEQPLPTKEEWWISATSIQRIFFLRAFFAEQGKQFEVVSDFMRPCTTCGGQGSLREIGSQGGVVKQTCPRCQGNKGDRTINYR